MSLEPWAVCASLFWELSLNSRFLFLAFLFKGFTSLSNALLSSFQMLDSTRCSLEFWEFGKNSSMLMLLGWLDPVSYTHLTLPTN